MIGFRCLKVKLSQDDGVAASDKRTAGVLRGGYKRTTGSTTVIGKGR